MTTLELLKCARNLITKKKRWSQHSNAEDATGRAVSAHDPSAVAWCATGALERCCPNSRALYDRAEKKLLATPLVKEFYEVGGSSAPASPGQGVVEDFNDTMGHKQVLKMFTQAIEAMEK